MKISWLISTTFCIALSLLSFGAVYQPIFLGYLAASPGVLFLFIPLFLHIMTFFFERAKLGFLAKESILLVILGVFLSVLSGLFFDYQPNFIYKAFSLGILVILWLSPLILSGYIRDDHLLIGLVFGILFCFIGLLNDIYPTLLPQSLKSLIFSGEYAANESGRWRGFSSEASQFSAILMRFLILGFLIRNFIKKYRPLSFQFFCIFLLFIAIFIASKGAVVSVLVSYFYAIGTRRHFFSLIITAMLFILLFLPSMISYFFYDLENFSSIGTRVVLVVTVLWSILRNPLGYGFYGFYPGFNVFGQDVLSLVDSSPLMLNEVNDIIINLTALSSKSTLLDFLMIFGVFFIFFIYRLLKFVNLKDPRSRFALGFFLLSGLYTSGHDSILMFLGLLILYRFSSHQKQKSIKYALNKIIKN